MLVLSHEQKTRGQAGTGSCMSLSYADSLVILSVLNVYRSCLMAQSSDQEKDGCTVIYNMTFLNRIQDKARLVLEHITHIWPTGTLLPLTCMCHQRSLWALCSFGVYQTPVSCPHKCTGHISSFLHGCFEASLIRNAVGITLPTTLPQRSGDTHSTSLSKEFSFNLLLLSRPLESPIGQKCD